MGHRLVLAGPLTREDLPSVLQRIGETNAELIGVTFVGDTAEIILNVRDSEHAALVQLAADCELVIEPD